MEPIQSVILVLDILDCLLDNLHPSPICSMLRISDKKTLCQLALLFSGSRLALTNRHSQEGEGGRRVRTGMFIILFAP
jgi:hypothetical protein